MRRLTELYPPYDGGEPYLYLCFSGRDAKRVRPLLHRLYERGCRLWYPAGPSATVAERAQRDDAMGRARLVVLFQTRHAREDPSVKSAVLVCQQKKIPILSLDTDDAESSLSMGLDSRAVHRKARGTDAQEAALLHADGFTQDLIGPPRKVRRRRVFGIAAVLLAAALALAGAAAVYGHLRAPADEPPADTVFFSDPALTAAVRDALDGGPVTEESVRQITALRLDAIPAKAGELARLPNLARIEVDQANADAAVPLCGQYEIVLTGGGP